jgi:cytochrome P450
MVDGSPVEAVLRCPGAYSSGMEATSLGNVQPLIPLQSDPPEHRRYRRILDPIFAPRQMAQLEDSVVMLAIRLIDQFIAAPVPAHRSTPTSRPSSMPARRSPVTTWARDRTVPRLGRTRR